MTTLRPFKCDDLFRFNNVNLDPLTETYNLGFYLTYLSRCCLYRVSVRPSLYGWVALHTSVLAYLGFLYVYEIISITFA